MLKNNLLNFKNEGDIKEAKTADDIIRCFSVIRELRPHITDPHYLATQVIRQQSQDYHLMYLENNNQIVAILGYRIVEYLSSGKAIYIDDLATLSTRRGKGYGGKLLNWIIDLAHKKQCETVHLDSGYTRFDAHRLYLNYGFQLKSHHFELRIR